MTFVYYMYNIIKFYFYLIKPRIVLSNVMSSIGGFLVASQGEIQCYPVFINTIIGVSCIVSSSCVLNNIIDRDIDAVMERTKNRVLVQHSDIFLNKSILYALTLGVIGFLFLSFTKNFLIVYLAATGMCIYVGVYSLWMKRTSIYSIIVGSISGAMPPVIGYCAVKNRFDIGSLILLMIFSLWQIPHSYSIAILRLHEYKMALIPIFPIKKGIKLTKNHIIFYIIGFIISTVLFTVMGYVSYIFLGVISVMNLCWLYVGLYGYKSTNNNNLWAKEMFLFSIIIIISVNLFLSLDSILFSI